LVNGLLLSSLTDFFLVLAYTLLPLHAQVLVLMYQALGNTDMRLLHQFEMLLGKEEVRSFLVVSALQIAYKGFKFALKGKELLH
jgi:hypothetical protein